MTRDTKNDRIVLLAVGLILILLLCVLGALFTVVIFHFVICQVPSAEVTWLVVRVGVSIGIIFYVWFAFDVLRGELDG